MVFTPAVHRIVIVGNIGIFRRICLTATIALTCSNVAIREKIDSSPCPVEFRLVHAQDVDLLHELLIHTPSGSGISVNLELASLNQFLTSIENRTARHLEARFKMTTIIGLTSFTAAMVAIGLAVCIRSLVSAWSVGQAWNWMIAALLAVLSHAVLAMPALQMSDAVTSAAAYFATTMLLTPLVTTLGARRPGIAPWHWFVVLPMVVVLQWPAASQLFGSHWRVPVELNAPATMGVLVVLVMSAGTLLGTNATSFTLVYSFGIVVLLTSVTRFQSAQSPVAACGYILILTAIWLALRNVRLCQNQLRNAVTTSERVHAVWRMFSGLYGFAWTRRVQDRINQFAPREQWTVRLTSAGFERLDGSSPTHDELQKPLESFIWVLTRFADEGWLQQVLNPQNPDDLTNPNRPAVPFN